MNSTTRVLILCTGNSCRSQMAEGYLRHFSGRRLEVRSAGLETHGLNPRAVAVMSEDGIDITAHRSDQVDDEMIHWADLVITVCGHADEHCPALPAGGEKRHIGFQDPAKATGADTEVMVEFRTVRDQIRHAMLGLALELTRLEAA